MAQSRTPSDGLMAPEVILDPHAYYRDLRRVDPIEEQGRMEMVRNFPYRVPMSVILEPLGAIDLDRGRTK